MNKYTQAIPSGLLAEVLAVVLILLFCHLATRGEETNNPPDRATVEKAAKALGGAVAEPHETAEQALSRPATNVVQVQQGNPPLEPLVLTNNQDITVKLPEAKVGHHAKGLGPLYGAKLDSEMRLYSETAPTVQWTNDSWVVSFKPGELESLFRTFGEDAHRQGAATAARAAVAEMVAQQVGATTAKEPAATVAEVLKRAEAERRRQWDGGAK